MVKTIIKSYASRVCGTKRVRGLKSRIKSNNSTKKVKNNSRKIQAKPFDMNYYSQPKINFLLSQEDNTITRLLKKESSEFSEIKPDETDFIYNYALCIAICRKFKIENTFVRKAFKTFKNIGGRLDKKFRKRFKQKREYKVFIFLSDIYRPISKYSSIHNIFFQKDN